MTKLERRGWLSEFHFFRDLSSFPALFGIRAQSYGKNWNKLVDSLSPEGYNTLRKVMAFFGIGPALFGTKGQREENMAAARTKKNSTSDSSPMIFYKKSNSLINAKGKSTAMGMKLFAAGLTHAKVQADGTVVAKFSGQELRRMFKRSNGSFYDQIKDLIKPVDESKPSILDWRIYIEDEENQHIEGINVITHARFQDGEMSLTYNSQLKDKLVNLKTNFSTLSWDQMNTLTSSYAIKLYESLSSDLSLEVARRKKMHDPSIPTSFSAAHPFARRWDYQELRQFLGVSAVVENGKKASRKGEILSAFGDFKRRALEKSKTEINEKTSLHMDYDVERAGVGGKVVGVIFYVYKQIPGILQDDVVMNVADVDAISPEEQKKIRKKVMGLLMDAADDADNITSKGVTAICKAAGYDYECIERAVKMAQRSSTPIHNLIGWVKKAIEDEYVDVSCTEVTVDREAPTARNKKSSFDSYEQRVYDEDIEDQILEAQDREADLEEEG